MKNVHIIPTDKPSRLHLKSDGFYLTKEENSFIPYSYPQDIYITSDVEIKEVRQHKGKWHLDKGQILKNYLTDLSECKLVILTTDPDLIKDGVQPISDEFLEWFVKNPSCEEVEVEIETTSIQLPQQQLSENSYDLAFRWINKKVYKIIIPQEEPKQETLEEAAEKWVFETNGHKWSNNDDTAGDNYASFKEGAMWQQERMYSELEVIELLNNFRIYSYNHGCGSSEFLEWFEQFKKK